jgi:hypothetical protein
MPATVSDRQPDQPPVDLADLARRAGAEALATLIEAARQRPATSVSVAAATVLLELAESPRAVATEESVSFTLHARRELAQSLELQIDALIGSACTTSANEGGPLCASGIGLHNSRTAFATGRRKSRDPGRASLLHSNRNSP